MLTKYSSKWTIYLEYSTRMRRHLAVGKPHSFQLWLVSPSSDWKVMANGKENIVNTRPYIVWVILQFNYNGHSILLRLTTWWINLNGIEYRTLPSSVWCEGPSSSFNSTICCPFMQLLAIVPVHRAVTTRDTPTCEYLLIRLSDLSVTHACSSVTEQYSWTQ